MASGGRKIKVLFLASWYPSRLNKFEGLFVKKHALAASMTADVSLLYVALDRELKEKYEICAETEDGILTVRVFFSKPKSRLPYFSFLFNIFRYAGSIRKGLKEIKERKGRPDIVQLNVASRLGLAAVFLKIFKKIPYIIVEHASTYIKFKNLDEYQEKVPLMERLILSLNYRYAAAAAGVSSFLVRGILKTQKFKKDIFVVPNVVDIPGIPEERKINSSGLKFLTIALLNKDKNIQGLIDAFSLAVKRHPDAELHIIGDGVEKQNLESQAAGLELLNKSIFLHGSVPNKDLDKYFFQSDIFILPSKYETFSVVTAEALAHGLPVIITRCGGPEDFVGEDQGLRVDGFDEKSIAEAIEQMFTKWQDYDPSFLNKYAQERFSIGAVSEKLAGIYQKVLTDK
ncbi:MAG: glycosyltransferase [Syntrophomonadaceae bacterium]